MATQQDLLFNIQANDASLVRATASVDRLNAAAARMNRQFYSSSAALKPLDQQLRGFGRRTVEIGRYLTRNFTVPLAFAGAAAVKMGYDFEQNLSKIQTLGGASAESIGGLRKDVVDLARSARTPGINELAKSLYFIRSSGFGAAEGIKVLQAANTGFRAGLGDLQTVADAVTSAMNAYGHSNLSAATAVDVMVATVRAGKAEPQELARSIGRVIPLAHLMGVSFKEVGGAIATMTLQGLSADQSVSGLRAILTTFTRGLPITQKALAGIGLSLTEMQKAIKTQGLEPTLLALRQRVDEFGASGGKLSRGLVEAAKLGGFDAAVQKLRKNLGTTSSTLASQLFPNVRALTAFLILTTNHGKQAANVFGQVAHSMGDAARAAKQADARPWARLQDALVKLRNEATLMGESLLKPVAVAAELVGKLLYAFNKLPGPIKNLAAANIVLLGVIGPLLIAYGNLIRLTSIRAIKRVTEAREEAVANEGVKASVDSVTAAYVREAEAAKLASAAAVTGARAASAANVAQAEVTTGVAAFGGGTMIRGAGGRFVTSTVARDAEKAAVRMNRLKTAVAGVGLGLATIGRFVWPVAVVEGTLLVASNLDLIKKKTDEATNAAKKWWEAIPGAKFVERVGGYDPFGIAHQLNRVLGFSGMDLLGVGKKQKDATNEVKKQTTFYAQIAHFLGISEKEAKRMFSSLRDGAGALNKAAQTARTAFENAFGRVTGDINTLFDEQTNQMLDNFDKTTQKLIDNMRVTVTVMGRTFTMKPGDKTPAERELDALQKSNDQIRIRRALLEAGKDLRVARLIGDPYGIADAQARIADARSEQRQAALQRRAERERAAVDAAAKKQEAAITARRDKERRALQAERDLQQRHLNDQLLTLQTKLEQHRITAAQFNTKLRALMRKYGVTAAAGATIIGAAFGQMLTESLYKLTRTIKKYADELGKQNKSVGKTAKDAGSDTKNAAAIAADAYDGWAGAAARTATRIKKEMDKIRKATQAAVGIGPITGGGNVGGVGAPAAVGGSKGGRRAVRLAGGSGLSAIQRGIVYTAGTQLGIPYQYGGPAKLGSRTDCSGLVQAVMRKNGIRVPRTAAAQYASAPIKNPRPLLPGDLVFYDSPHIGHVAIYLGNGRIIEDPHTGDRVKITSIATPGPVVASARWWARRPGGRRLASAGGRGGAATAGQAPTRGLSAYRGGATTAYGTVVGGATRINRVIPQQWAGTYGSDIGGQVRVGGLLSGLGGLQQTAAGQGGLISGGRMAGLSALPPWLRPIARRTIRMIARRDVQASRIAYRLAHGQHVSQRAIFASLPPRLSATLSAAQKRRLGPEGTKRYLQWLAGVEASPSRAGLIRTHGLGRPFTLGPAGQTGNVQNITINVYESGNPRRTARAVREELQKHSKRNAISPRGRNSNQKIGLR